MNTLTMSLLNATWFAGYKQLSFFTDTSLALQLLNSEADINIAQEFGIGILILICSIVILGLIQQLLSFISRPPVEKKTVSVTIVSDFECILLEKLSYLESTSARKLMRTLQSELPTLELKQVNSVLYKMLNRNLVIMRKEGEKPIWSLAL
jgi:hypothetical protein